MPPRFPFARITTMRCVTLTVCLFATACGGQRAESPTAPTSATDRSNQTQARAGEGVPFRGSLTALETVVVAPPSLLVNGTATGTGTHLGRFTATYTATITLATGSATGNISFTAANGDRLDATFIGQTTPAAEPNVSSIEELGTIAGGTGRFADATGTFTIQRVLDHSTGESSGSFDGFINPGT